MKFNKIIAAVAAAIALVLTSACSITGDGVTDPSFQTLRYDGGFAQGSKFKECVSPGTKMVGDDTYYPYPTSQREDVWDSDNYNQGSNSADHPDMQLTDKDGNAVFVKMKVSFFLNTDCSPVTVDGHKYPGGTLQAFHELVGKTRHAYFNEDGGYGKGWLWAMDNYISSSAQDYLTPQVRTTSALDAWLKPEVKDSLEKGLAENIAPLVDAGMETDLHFYKNFSVKIYNITPDDEYLSMYRDRQNANIKAQTAEANRKAKIAEAEANAAVAEANAKIKQAEIKGYGGFSNYKCIYLADKGLNCAQPQYVVGSR